MVIIDARSRKVVPREEEPACLLARFSAVARTELPSNSARTCAKIPPKRAHTAQAHNQIARQLSSYSPLNIPCDFLLAIEEEGLGAQDRNWGREEAVSLSEN